MKRAAELGADAAVCSRRHTLAQCSVGYAPREWPAIFSLHHCHRDGQHCHAARTDVRRDLLRDPWKQFEFPEDAIEELADLREGHGTTTRHCREFAHSRQTCPPVTHDGTPPRGDHGDFGVPPEPEGRQRLPPDNL